MRRLGIVLTYGACTLAFASGCAKVESGSSAITACTPPTLVSTPTTTDCTPAAPASGTHTGNVLVSWTPNKEGAVNTTGGGYRIEYSTDPSFPVGSTTTVNAPYSANSQMLTGLAAGDYCIRITAYSAINTTGATTLTKVGVP